MKFTGSALLSRVGVCCLKSFLSIKLIQVSFIAFCISHPFPSWSVRLLADLPRSRRSSLSNQWDHLFKRRLPFAYFTRPYASGLTKIPVIFFLQFIADRQPIMVLVLCWLIHGSYGQVRSRNIPWGIYLKARQQAVDSVLDIVGIAGSSASYYIQVIVSWISLYSRWILPILYNDFLEYHIFKYLHWSPGLGRPIGAAYY